MNNRPAAWTLACLARTIRPAWDELHLTDVLLGLLDQGHDLADVAHVAIRSAQDPTIRTPTGVAFVDGPHWRATRAVTETEADRTARLMAQAAERQRLAAEDAELEQQAEQRARHRQAARAAIAAAAERARTRQETTTA